MAMAFGPTCSPCTFVPESELSHILQAPHGLVPKLAIMVAKTIALRAQKPRLPLCATDRKWGRFSASRVALQSHDPLSRCKKADVRC